MKTVKIEREENYTIRMKESEFKELIVVAKAIEKSSDDINESNHLLRFSGKNYYPTVDELKKHDIEKNIDKFLPTLLFYYVAEIDDGSQKYKEMKEYVSNVIVNKVKAYNDKDLKPIESLTKYAWDNLKKETEIKTFKKFIDNYNDDEFNSFALDLGWQKFMVLSNPKYTKRDFVQGEMPEVTYNKLKTVWNNCKKKK